MSEHTDYQDMMQRSEIEAERARQINMMIDAMDVEAEFQHSATLRRMMEQLERDQSGVLKALAYVNPGNLQHVTELQARAFCLEWIKQFLEDMKQRSKLAHQAIQAEQRGGDI